jgi:hypothetical protein
VRVKGGQKGDILINKLATMKSKRKLKISLIRIIRRTSPLEKELIRENKMIIFGEILF